MSAEEYEDMMETDEGVGQYLMKINREWYVDARLSCSSLARFANDGGRAASDNPAVLPNAEFVVIDKRPSFIQGRSHRRTSLRQCILLEAIRDICDGDEILLSSYGDEYWKD